MPLPLKETEASGQLLQKYVEILESHGITHPISEVKFDVPDCLKGEGTTGHVYYVTVNFKDSAQKPLHLFSKTRIQNESRDEWVDGMKLFEKEARFYRDYVPAAREFCKKYGREDLLEIYPKCYYADDKLLLFENLVMEKGYILLKKQDRQGLQPAKIALKTLAKHHAISYAFIKASGGPQEFFQKFLNLNFDWCGHEVAKNFLNPLIQNGISTNIRILQNSNAKGKEEAIALLKAHYDKGYDLLWEELQYIPENEKILTLNHGDFWNGNGMFLKDETTQTFTDHKTFDLQATRYNSPLLDVGNFMYTSMKPDARRNHREELLKTYLDTLIETSKDLGCSIELTYEELYEIFRQKFKYGFWFAIWLATEASYAVIGNVQVEDPNDFTKEFDRQVEKYIVENPEKTADTAVDLVELMKEYTDLLQN